jgi:hypothetical protein
VNNELPTAVTADTPAPELELTVAPTTEDKSTPDASTEEVAKVFTQEELDSIVGKRLAREQRKWERDQAQRVAEQQATPASVGNLHVSDFESPEAYAEVLAERKAEELLARREDARQQSAILDAYHDKEEEARAKYDDFQQVAYNPSLSISSVMAQAIQSSDIGPELIYHLGVNPKEADRIARLPAVLQAKEIGRLEATMASNPPVRKTSTAPAPIAPVTARTTGSSAYDTTDPRSIKAMSTSDWIEAERQRQAKKFEASRNR